MTVVLLCYDLAKPVSDQIKQILYWLGFLNSALPLPSPSATPSTNWLVVLVGLRADLQNPLDDPNAKIQPQYILTWQRKWKRLPLFRTLFNISSITAIQGVYELLGILEPECKRIMDQHAMKIPPSYLQILEMIQNRNNQQVLIHKDDLHKQFEALITAEGFTIMLKYFHAIGHIVLTKEGLVCTNPQLISKIVANFISPMEIRARLLKRDEEKVQVLEEDDIGDLLSISFSNERYANKYFKSQPYSYPD